MSTERRIQRLQRKHEQEDRAHQDAAMHELLASFTGRRLLWWMLGESGLARNPYAATDRDTAFNCGELNLALRLMARLTELEPDRFVQMMKENEDVQRSRAADTAALASGDDTPGDDAGDDAE